MPCLQNVAWVVIFVTHCFFSSAVCADFFLYGSTNLGFSDNATLGAESSPEELDQGFLVNAIYDETTRRYVASLNYIIQHQRYYKDVFQNETNFTGSGELSLSVVEDRLDWDFSYQRATFLSGSNVKSTPGNREERGTFSTGPSLFYELTSASTLELFARYTESEGGNSTGNDSKRNTAGAEYTFELNPITSFSLSADYSDVFEFGRGDEFVQTDWTVGLQREFVWGEVDSSYGLSRISKNGEDEDIEEESFEAGITSELLGNEVNFRASKQITDTTLSASQILTGEEGALSDPVFNGQGDIVKNVHYEVSVARTVGGVDVVLLSFEDEQEYVSRIFQDNKEGGAQASFSAAVSRSVGVNLSIFRSKTQFRNRPEVGTSDSRSYILALGVEHSQRLDSTYEVGFRERLNSSDTQNNYEEITASLQLNYQFY